MKYNSDCEPNDTEGFKELKAEEKRWQDDIGNDLIEQSYQCEGSRFVYERQFEKIMSGIEIKENASLLEIGCGRGQYLNKIAEIYDSAQPKLFGLDLSSGLIELKQRYNKDIHWIMADGEDLPFADKVFDIVLFNGSLHHMPDYEKAMQEAFRTVRPDGRILLFEPISTFFSRTMHHLLDPFVFKKTKYESPVDEYCKDSFRLERLHSIITEAGYTYSKSWHDFLAYPLTGCYAGSYFSKSAGLMEGLASLEDFLQKIPIIKYVCDFFCWRVLIDIHPDHV